MDRDRIIDAAKVIGVFLVVWAHLYGSDSTERLYIYSFHMPLFFMLSGMLHKFNGHIQLKKYIKKCLYPAGVYFFIFSCLYLFLIKINVLDDIHMFISNAAGGGNSLIINYLCDNFLALVYGRDCSNVVLWFLFALFYCKIATDCLLKWKYTFCVWGVIFIIATILRYSVCYIGQGMMAMPFYFVGYLIRKSYTNIFNVKCPLVLACIFLLLSIILTQVNGRVSMSGLNFGSVSLFPLRLLLFYFNALLGSFAVLLLSKYFSKVDWSGLSSSMISILGLQMIFVKLYVQFFGYESNALISIFSSLLIITICHYSHKFLLNKILKLW